MAVAVNDLSAEMGELAREFPMLDALMAGTPAMRKARAPSANGGATNGWVSLPKWPNEDDSAYTSRIAVATLFPAYRRTVSVMASKPFSKPLTFSADAPIEIAGKPAQGDQKAVPGWADDIDCEGVGLHAFAAEMFTESFYGLAGILVEAPKPIDTGKPVVTRADEKAAGVRPYFVRVKHNQILGWRTEKANGARVLSQLRIFECASEEDGDFGQKDVQRVRVLEPGSWRLYQKSDKPGPDGKVQWPLIEGPDGSGTTGLSYIPFVPLYGWRKGFMCGAPPMLDLAYLNVKHWQKQSDLDNIEHVACVPILTIIGGDETTSLTVGAASAVRLPIGADLKYVEHSGQGVGKAQDSLDKLEGQMIQTGAELLVKKPGDRSATESANDAEANKCDLQRMAEGFEAALDQALKYMADFASLPTGGKVSLYKDYGAATLSDASAQLVLAMEQAGLITKQTAITEYQRRGTLSPDIDPAIEVQAAADQGPSMGALTLNTKINEPGANEPAQAA